MAHREKLHALCEKIAKENNYNDCRITLEPVSSGGANYSSYLFRGTLSAPGKEDLQLFAKTAALGEEIRASVPASAFTIEHHFYADLVKKYRQIEEKYSIRNEDRLLTAKFYGASPENMHESLVLENLTKRGFESFDRFKAIDWSYARYSIKQLALFHALSLAFAKEDPEEHKKFMTTTLVPIPKEAMSEMLKINVEKTVAAIKEENREKVAKFLDRPDVRNPMYHLLDAKGPMIIHVDYRPSNMMHKVLDDGSIEVIVLDYQTLREGCPVVDLLYFLFLGSDKKFRSQYWQKSLDHYYQELSAALRRFEIDPDEVYTKETYEKDLKTIIPYMLSLSFFTLLVITIDEAAGQVTENIDILKADLDANALYVERINDWVDDCIAMGVL